MECKVIYFTCRVDSEHDLRVSAYVGIETRTANFCYFAGVPGTTQGAKPFRFREQAHFAEEVSGVQVGDNNFLVFIIFEDNGIRTLNDVIPGVAFVALINNGGSIRITLSMSMG